MLKDIFNKLKNNAHLILSLSTLVLAGYLFLTTRSMEKDRKEMFDELAARLDSIAQSLFRLEQSKHPKVTSSQDFHGEKTNFTFSPNKKLIAFVQNVFEEYGNDWDRYWALKVFDPETDGEKTLVVDDTRMSSYIWLDNKTIRVFHNAGTGVRVYLDVSANRVSPLFTKDYEGPEIWTPDIEHSQKTREVVEAERVYFEKTKQKEEVEK